MAIRRDLTSLTRDERNDYVEGVKRLKAEIGRKTDLRGNPINTYDYFVEIHNETQNRPHPPPGPHQRKDPNAAHMGPAFLPWHRAFLLQLEAELQRVLGKPAYGLPYWNWAADADLPDPKKALVWSDEFMGGDGNPVASGPFSKGKWKILHNRHLDKDGVPSDDLYRELGQSPLGRTLPTQSEVDRALSVTPYDCEPWNSQSGRKPGKTSFRNTLEGWLPPPGESIGLHNRVHVWIGGAMGPAASPNDPVFFLHHCNVDRLWALWQAKHPIEKYLPEKEGDEGQKLNDTMWGVGVTPASQWESTADYREPASHDPYSLKTITTKALVEGNRGSAFLSESGPVAVDQEHNLYFTDLHSDPKAQRIAKVERSGRITTAVDIGQFDLQSLYGRGTGFNPRGLAVDESGNLYFVDGFTARVRKLDRQGKITTVAGTGIHSYNYDDKPATEAWLYTPLDVAVDAGGNVFIADSQGGNQPGQSSIVRGGRIRRVDKKTGTITTVVGTGDYGSDGDNGPATMARLCIPNGLAVYGPSLRRMYIADGGSHTVRRVDEQLDRGWTIKTVAGTGEEGFSEDGGLATEARLHSPAAVAEDAYGNLLIGELGRVRKVDQRGIITTVAGSVDRGFAGEGDGGPAWRAGLWNVCGLAVVYGDLYIGDSYSGRVRHLNYAS